MEHKQYLITSDSTCDMPASFYEEENIPILPYTFIMNEESFLDDHLEEEAYDAFFLRIKNEKLLPTTAQVNLKQASDFFEPLLKDGYDVIHLHFASALSGSYNNVCVVAQELREKYPEREITIIDTKSATLGQGLILWYAIKRKKEGMGYKEMVSYVTELSDRLCHYFTVDDLNYLHRGGRLSKASAIVGSMLQVKPMLEISKEGKVEVIGKVRGRKTSLDKLVKKFLDTYVPEENEIIFLCHSLSLKEAQEVAKAIEEKTGITNFFYHSVGPVIGSHTGPGAVAVFYVGRER